MKEKVEASKELGMLSKELARIMLDVPVEFDEKDFEMSEPDVEVVTQIFQELEFRRLIDNFLKTFGTETETTSKTTEASNADNPKKQVQKNRRLQEPDNFHCLVATLQFQKPRPLQNIRETQPKRPLIFIKVWRQEWLPNSLLTI